MRPIKFSDSEAAQRFAAQAIANGCGGMVVAVGNAFFVRLWDRV